MAKNSGFTLVELMIAIAISALAMGAAYSLFISQQKTYTAQQGVLEIQQNARAGMYYLAREIRLAGFNHRKFNKDGIVGIIEAGPGKVRFTMDIYDNVNDDGDVDGLLTGPNEIGFCDKSISISGEDIIYALMDDADSDGLPDTLTPRGTPMPDVLGRDDVIGGGGPDPLVEDIEAIGFAYAYDNDGDGKLDFADTDGNGVQDSGEPTFWAVDTDNDQWLDTNLDTDADGDIDADDTAGGGAMPSGDVHVDQIRSVRLWILVKSPNPDVGFVNQETYVIGDKHLAVNDNFRRRLLTASIMCRNMGG